MNFNLAIPLYRNCRAVPGRIALSANGVDLTYAELTDLVRRIALALPGSSNRQGRVGILASRSIEACAGALGSVWSGAAYFPINLKLPEERLAALLELCDLDALIADERGASMLSPRVMGACPKLILVPDEKTAQLFHSAVNHDVRALTSLRLRDEAIEPAYVRSQDVGYTIFTSGTTGVPKGVMVSAGAVHHYLSVMQAEYRLTPEDRTGETTELSFDLSVSNMFLTWNAGASLHVIPSSQVMAPAKFVRERNITVWFSVPSVIALMKRMKSIRSQLMPSLRLSFFAGEALPLTSANAWHEAAPNSRIDCLYGPTETTVVCTGGRVTDPPVVTPERGIITIGKPFPGMEAAIVDDHLNFLPPGRPGEMALSGPQVANGYFAAPELTAARFPIINGKRWYLSGDLCYQDSEGRYHHLGRTDNQVKVLGHRVELEEVEAHLRAVTGTEMVAAIAWPTSHGTAEGIVAFIAGIDFQPEEVREALGKRMPAYMVPATIRTIDALPMNNNGKVDRKVLLGAMSEL